MKVKSVINAVIGRMAILLKLLTIQVPTVLQPLVMDTLEVTMCRNLLRLQ